MRTVRLRTARPVLALLGSLERVVARLSAPARRRVLAGLTTLVAAAGGTGNARSTNGARTPPRNGR